MTQDPKIIFPFSQNYDYRGLKKIDQFTKFGFISNDKEFLDTSLGNCGCFLLGFDRNDIINRVNEKMISVPFVSGEFMTTNSDVINLTDKLFHLTGGYRSFFSLSGSDAVEGAIKVARLKNLSDGKESKKIVLGLNDSYHGSTYLSSSISGSSMMSLYLGKTDFCKNIPKPTIGDEEYCLHKTKKIVAELGKDNISCLVIETCSWLSGLISYSNEYWIELQKLCKENQIILIIDDIAMCGGKTGKINGFSIRPDVFTMGKSFSGGYFPLSSFMISDEVYNSIKKEFFIHGFTYSFNMSGIYSTLAYLDIIENEKIFENYDLVLNSAKRIFIELRQKGLIKEFRNYGLFFNIIFNNQNLKLIDIFYENGIHPGIESHECKNLFVIIPLTADKEYFTELERRLTNSFNQLLIS